MVTVRKLTTFIIVGILRQINSTVIESTSCSGGRVSESRKGFEDGRIKAFFFESGCRKRIFREHNAAEKVAEVHGNANDKDDEYEYEEKKRGGYHDLAVKITHCFQGCKRKQIVIFFVRVTIIRVLIKWWIGLIYSLK